MTKITIQLLEKGTDGLKSKLDTQTQDAVFLHLALTQQSSAPVEHSLMSKNRVSWDYFSFKKIFSLFEISFNAVWSPV